MNEPAVQFVPHYDMAEIRSIEELRRILPLADEMNWLFLSTSGVHGSYSTLDDLERTWDRDPEGGGGYGHDITVLVVRPRLVSVRYGHIGIERGDIPWLREQVDRTLDAISRTQQSNTP